MRLKGFTLIELIVVIVIIGILAGLGIPAYEKAADEAHKKEAFSNLNVISAGELGYFYENNAYLPAAIGSFSGANNNVRDALEVNVYDSTDWQYSVAGNGQAGTAARATATATRMRGKRAGNVIWLKVTSSTASAITGKYAW